MVSNLAWFTAVAVAFAARAQTVPPTGATDPVQPLTVAISGTALEIVLLPIGASGKGQVFLGKTEVPWELLDAFVFSRDAGSGPARADAMARPSKPYISMDRGFGHAGFPAISVSDENARLFCDWLSAKTGKKFRLPTLGEFQRACSAGSSDAVALANIAWYLANSNKRTHRVGSLQAMSNGFHDLKGNAAEWVTTDDGRCALVGGAYNDPEESVHCSSIKYGSLDWNASDPQIPPSRWWLADGSFAGFRVACEDPSPTEKRSQP